MISVYRASAELKREPLVIVSGGMQHRFMVEVARTLHEITQGLMHRTELPAAYGMLFDFAEGEQLERPADMWMRNTHIPLDMLFIRANGRVSSIEKNAVPFSEKLIKSGRPVRSVLELYAGTADRLGLRAGDCVHHELFSSHPQFCGK